MAGIKTPFAVSGTRAPIPESDLGGGVSMVNGYPSTYDLPTSDPDHRLIERDTFNQLMFLMSSAIKEIQERGAAPWFSILAPYGINAEVFHNGKMWQSTAINNNTEPGVSGSAWVEAHSWDTLTGKPVVIASGSTQSAARLAIDAASTAIATTVINGLMSASDKAKLDGIAPSANNYTLPNAAPTITGGIRSRYDSGTSTWYITTDGTNP